MQKVRHFFARLTVLRLLLFFIPLSIILLILRARSDVEVVMLYVEFKYRTVLQEILDSNEIDTVVSFKTVPFSDGMVSAEVEPSQIIGKEYVLFELAKKHGFALKIHYRTKWKQFSYMRQIGATY